MKFLLISFSGDTMKRIGPHVSISGGVQNAPLNAKKLNATAFGMFTKNQRQWVAKPYDSKTIDAFKENLAACGYKPEHVLAHDGYLINIGSPDPVLWEKSFNAMVDEMERCHLLGIPYLNMHPGSHVQKSTEDECLDKIADSINKAHDKIKDVTIVIENTAGQGSNVGYKFEHLAHIIDKVENKKRIGICIDTCHTFAAGYDLLNDQYEITMKSIESIVGLKYLKGFHLNDSKSKLGSRVDRHENIGKGILGIEFFKKLMKDPRFDEIPMVLETIDETLWPEEIALLKNFAK